MLTLYVCNILLGFKQVLVDLEHSLPFTQMGTYASKVPEGLDERMFYTLSMIGNVKHSLEANMVLFK